MKKKITIIGAGMMGSALAFPAAENGHDVHIVGTCLDDEIIDGYISTGKHEKFCRPFPENVHYHYFKDWKEVVKGSDFVIGGVSSFGVDWFLDEILTNLDPDMPVLSVTKGLRATEDGTLLSYPGYWESELAKRGINRTICAVGGPCTSYELVFMDPTEVGFCGKDSDALRRIGLQGQIARELDNLAYFGRGPQENYSDRNDGIFLGLWKTSPEDMMYQYVFPQENGNRTDVRWVSCADDKGRGVVFVGSQPLSVSAWNTTQDQLQEAMHIGEPTLLTGSFVLNLDLVQTGVGGTDSWSQRARPYDQYRLLDKNYSYDFWMIPIKSPVEAVDAGRKYYR